MSDAAVVELHEAQRAPSAKSVAIVSPTGTVNAGTEATYAALLSSLPYGAVTVSGPVSEALLAKFDCDSTEGSRSSISKAVSEADAVIVAAPHFDANVSSAMFLARLTFDAHVRGKAIALVGATARKSSNRIANAFTKFAIRRADLTVMRDEASADNLLQSGVEGPLRVGADPAWSELGELFAAPERSREVVVALNDEIDSSSVDRLVGALTPVAASGVDIALQPWSKSRMVTDRVGEVASRVGDNVTVLPAPNSLREARDAYTTSRAVLALRFHAVMAAACAGSRTLAMGDDAMQKLASALELSVVPASATPKDISAALLQTLESGPVGSRAVPQLVDRAKATIDLVRLLLTEGEDSTPTANNQLPLYPTAWRQ